MSAPRHLNNNLRESETGELWTMFFDAIEYGAVRDLDKFIALVERCRAETPLMGTDHCLTSCNVADCLMHLLVNEVPFCVANIGCFTRLAAMKPTESRTTIFESLIGSLTRRVRFQIVTALIRARLSYEPDAKCHDYDWVRIAVKNGLPLVSMYTFRDDSIYLLALQGEPQLLIDLLNEPIVSPIPDEVRADSLELAGAVCFLRQTGTDDDVRAAWKRSQSVGRRYRWPRQHFTSSIDVFKQVPPVSRIASFESLRRLDMLALSLVTVDRVVGLPFITYNQNLRDSLVRLRSAIMARALSETRSGGRRLHVATFAVASAATDASLLEHVLTELFRPRADYTLPLLQGCDESPNEGDIFVLLETLFLHCDYDPMLKRRVAELSLGLCLLMDATSVAMLEWKSSELGILLHAAVISSTVSDAPYGAGEHISAVLDALLSLRASTYVPVWYDGKSIHELACDTPLIAEPLRTKLINYEIGLRESNNVNDEIQMESHGDLFDGETRDSGQGRA